MKLSAKASLLLTGLVLAVIAATSFFLFAYQQRAIKDLVTQQLESEANSLAVEIRAFVDENIRDMGAIAGNMPAGRFQAGDLGAIREYLARQSTYYPKFENGFFLLDREGRFLSDYPPHPELNGQSFAHRDYFTRTIALERGVIGDPYISTRSGLPVLTITAPLKGPGGEIEGVLCGSLNLLSPWALGEQQQRRIGKTGYIYVMDRSRRFIIHTDSSRILKPLEKGRNLFLDKAVEGFEGPGETINSLGVPLLIASRQIPTWGWVVLTQMPIKEALAPMHEAALAVGLFFLGALALVLPVGLAAMRRITRPLEALERATHVISQDLRKPEGAFTRPFASSAMDALRGMRSSDEIGKLARAFFQLSVRLKQTLGSLRSAAEDWERTFSSVQEALLVIDGQGKVLRINRVAEDLFRTVKTKAIGVCWREVLAMGNTPPDEWPSSESIRESSRFKTAASLPDRPGRFELSFSAIQGRKGDSGHLLMVTDVTEKMQAEERIRDMAFHDALTRLPNRLLLTDRLEQAVATAMRNGTKVGVLFLDLDDFKQVNDTFGHKTGDELLVQVAGRIAGCLRSNDTLARYAGDEFVVVLMDLRSPDEAANIASRILAALSPQFDLTNGKASIGASIGIAVYPEDGVTPNLLLNHADTAMYRAKSRGKNSYLFADSPSMATGEGLPKQ
jgi:diguanylate cyclase (GGDEF)-like protein